MDVYDLCLAWNWEFDGAFSAILERACADRGLTLLQLTPQNLPELWDALQAGQVNFHAMLDRASEVDSRFSPVVDWAIQHGVTIINPPHLAQRSWNKAAMHLALKLAGVPTPTTLVLPSWLEAPDLPPVDLTPLGKPFVVKPAHGSGGEGVVLDAHNLEAIDQARRQLPNDQVLVQATVYPALLDGRPAWFRLLVCAGQVYPCWWHPQTHHYAHLELDDELALGLGFLRALSAAIGEVCALETFSTEVALGQDGTFVAVDYVNDQIDLRPQSSAADGVPDDVVEDIAARLADLVLERRSEQTILAPVIFLSPPHHR